MKHSWFKNRKIQNNYKLVFQWPKRTEKNKTRVRNVSCKEILIKISCCNFCYIFVQSKNTNNYKLVFQQPNAQKKIKHVQKKQILIVIYIIINLLQTCEAKAKERYNAIASDVQAYLDEEVWILVLDLIAGISQNFQNHL